MCRQGIAKFSSISRIALAALAIALLTHAPAFAHQASITRSSVEINHEQTEVHYRIKLDPPDTSEIIGLGEDVNPSDQDVMAGKDRLFEHILGHIKVADGERVCPVERGDAAVVTQGARFVELTWTARCGEPIDTLVIEYDLFFELDALHRGLLRVTYRGDNAVTELKPGAARFVWDLEEPAPSNLLAFVHSGVEHIIYGFDHIAFVLGLLLVVAIARPKRKWELRELGPGLRYTAGIVTSFTIAHSITLIAASLDLISLNSRLVEAIIAGSIVYVAIENILVPDTRRRYVVTFLFGLIHGLGFASMLKVLLPPDGVVGPLLMFNIGVELGQLAIVIAVLPLLHLTARLMTPQRYRTVFLPAASGILAVLGLLWLIERAFEVTILGL